MCVCARVCVYVCVCVKSVSDCAQRILLHLCVSVDQWIENAGSNQKNRRTGDWREVAIGTGGGNVCFYFMRMLA
jgi:hypothetical protein